jgi:hypothetical protein
VRSWIGAVSLSGGTLRVSVPEPLPADGGTLAVAGAIRVFERFPALADFVLVAGGGGETTVTRADVERLLAPEGWRALEDRGRWPEVLARAVERHASAGAGGGP